MTEAQATELLTRAGEIEALLYVLFFVFLGLLFVQIANLFGNS
jgi:hypothetical protein